MRFCGKQVAEIADRLRRDDPGAVIIIQADHGHGDIFMILSQQRPPLDVISAQYGMLSAIYLPPGIVMPEKITPVNLFRYIFNALFDVKLEILPNRSFFTKIKEPYKFYEVTNALK